MKTIENMYAVVVVKPNSREICSTYNSLHDAWQPAIFETEEGASNYLEEISSMEFEYSIVEVGVVL